MSRSTIRGATDAGRVGGRKRKPQALKVPTRSQLQAVVSDLGLAEGPAAILDYVIKDALADLRSYRRLRERRAIEGERLAEPIDELHSLLTKLVSFLDANPAVLKEILPATTGARLGALFSFAGIGEALDRDAYPDDTSGLEDYRHRNSLPTDIATAEKFYARLREDHGLLHGDTLLLHTLRVVLEPLAAWAAAKAANKGGRPANIERRYLIERLAKAAPEILGAKPTVSVGSRFVDLCERVLPLCGFAEDGIDKAVVSVLTALRSGAKPTASIGPKP